MTQGVEFNRLMLQMRTMQMEAMGKPQPVPAAEPSVNGPGFDDLLKQAVDRGDTQAIIATHSPVLMTFPGATILSLDDGRIRPVRLEETSHYEITRGILACPERYWKHLGD